MLIYINQQERAPSASQELTPLNTRNPVGSTVWLYFSLSGTEAPPFQALMLGVRGGCAPVCAHTHTRDRILPLCPSLHCCIGKEETPFSPLATQVFLPASLVFPIAMLPSTTALNENGLRNLPSKKKKKNPWPDPQSPSPATPPHSPIWILLGKLAPTTAPRKPVQKKAKMYGIFLFTLAKKKPWSNHRFGLPSPSFDSSCCSAGSFPPAVPCLLLSFLPSFCEVSLVSLGRGAKQLNCSLNTD